MDTVVVHDVVTEPDGFYTLVSNRRRGVPKGTDKNGRIPKGFNVLEEYITVCVNAAVSMENRIKSCKK